MSWLNLNVRRHHTHRFMRTIKAISKGVRAALKKPQPQKFEVAGRVVTCSFCSGEIFRRHDLHKSFGDPLASHPHAYGLECATCHHLELFAKQPVEIDHAA